MNARSASPKANALLQPADLHGEDHRLDRCAFLRHPACLWLRAQCSRCYRAITAEGLGERADYRYLTPVMAEYQVAAI